MYIDSHCHLDHEKFNQDRQDVIQRARQAGVETLISIGTDLETSQQAINIARSNDGIYATVGLHPHEVDAAPADYLQQLKALAQDARVVAIGEIGLDYHYDFGDRGKQRARFAEQIALARELELPIVVHVREAEDDCLKIIDEVGLGSRGGVIHCFSSSLAFSREVLKRGLIISIPGIVTYKKPGDLPEVVRQTSLDKMMIETDAPYLAPVPHRGKRNEPAFVVDTARFIAELTEHSLEDIQRATTATTRRFFDLPGDSQNDKASIAYQIRNTLYLNITNACTLACTFCPKQQGRYVVKGHPLHLQRAPSVEEIKQACGEDLSPYDEVVFVGLGESTLRLDVLKEVAAWLKSKGQRVRLDTDGLANLVYKRNVAAELAGLIDAVSVSLNAPDAQSYNEICPSKHGPKAFAAVQDFIAAARKAGIDVTASIVALPRFAAKDLEKARQIAENSLKVKFRIRAYDLLG